MNHTSDSNSPLDDFMQSLSLDAHQPHNIEHSHNNLHDSSQIQNLNHLGISDITHSDWTDTSHNFSQQHPQSDWTHSNDIHHTDNQWQNPESGFATEMSATNSDWADTSHNFNQQHYQSDWTHSHDIHHQDTHQHNSETGFASATNHHDNHTNAAPHVVNSSYSNSGDGPFIHIDRSGDVHLHKLDGTTQVVGHVHGRDFYNSASEHIGYLSKNGHICRWADDTSVGRVESGHIYRENGKEVGRADTDLEGAAHMLFAVRGGTY
ncbi:MULTISPECIES: hypothetical protein [unclassified Microcoleus]|uniref:hypothetical protein n=1 Tax=unclassified Microcoleus TaxID=2642155 RepID=UPI002FCF705A